MPTPTGVSWVLISCVTVKRRVKAGAAAGVAGHRGSQRHGGAIDFAVDGVEQPARGRVGVAEGPHILEARLVAADAPLDIGAARAGEGRGDGAVDMAAHPGILA